MTKCPVCDNRNDFSLVEKAKTFKIWKCPSCELEFSDPMDYDNQLYNRLYRDETSDMSYSDSPRVASFLKRNSKQVRKFLELNQLYALRWIKRNSKPGTKVLDIGCGSGSFLFALKSEGLKPFGTDVAKAAVEALERASFNVVQGSLHTVPEEWGNFDVVTLFEVLEHLSNPLEFLSSIKRKWPDATLILSVPDPKRVYLLFHNREAGDYPPHHLTRWTPRALETALIKAGFKHIHIKRLPPRGSQVVARTGIVAFLRRKRGKTPELNPDKPFYGAPAPIIAKDILFWPVAMVAWLFGWHNTQMVFIAH